MKDEHAVCFDEFLQVLLRYVTFYCEGNMNQLEQDEMAVFILWLFDQFEPVWKGLQNHNLLIMCLVEDTHCHEDLTLLLEIIT